MTTFNHTRFYTGLLKFYLKNIKLKDLLSHKWHCSAQKPSFFSSQRIEDVIMKCTELLRLSISHPAYSAKHSSAVVSETSCTLNEHTGGTTRKVINNDARFHAITVLLAPTSHSKIYIRVIISIVLYTKEEKRGDVNINKIFKFIQ